MDEHLTIIEPRRGLFRISPSEMFNYRDLFLLLTMRDVRVRYQQTVFGALWAILQPLMLMVVFAVFLGRLADVPSQGLPYTLFAYAGLVPWTFFSQGLTGATSSLVENERLVTKVYFPRLLVPAAAAASYSIDFVIGHVLLIGMVVYYDVDIRAPMLLLPLLGVAVYLAALAYGIGLSAMNVRYRDVRYAVPFAVQVLLFVTPVVYPADLVTGAWRYVYALNPISSVVDLYRWALLDTPHLPGSVLAVSAVALVVYLVIGITYFQRVERSFADVI